MKYLIYTLSNDETGLQVVVEDKKDICESVEEVARRYFAHTSACTVNLEPRQSSKILGLNLREEGFSVGSIDWIERGVPDLLLLSNRGDKQFVEVKSAGDGLSEYQIRWVRKFDYPHLVAYVVEIGDDNVDVDVQIGGESLFEVDSSIRGREEIIDLCYADIESRDRAGEIRTILDLLSDERIVSASSIMSYLGLQGVSGRRELEKMMIPLFGYNKNGYSPVRRYRVDHLTDEEFYYYLTRNGLRVSELDADFRDIERMREYIGEPRRLRVLKQNKGIDAYLVSDPVGSDQVMGLEAGNRLEGVEE